MSLFQAPQGTRDVLAPESARFEQLQQRFATACHLAGYGMILTPMFEDVGVFRRGVGEQSEVVTKEMYEFEDKGGRSLALRPEGTASVVRAYLQHRPLVPYKAWYASSAFRYESPQAGRYREHHQLGVEVLGTADPDVDVEVIALLADFIRDIGLRRVSLRINSLGDGTCRPGYRELLLAYLDAHAAELCDEHRSTYARNPLRVLDCKRPSCRAVAAGAPKILDSLCESCATAFARVRAGLEELAIAYEIDTSLVRGLDYYTRTTFEFASLALEGAQNAVGGGGRYDGLAVALGGVDTPGIGFGAGVERLLLAADAEGVEIATPAVAVFVIDLVGGTVARKLTSELRRAGVACDRGFDGRSLKSQLTHADRSGAAVAIIVGQREIEADLVTVRLLRGGGDNRQEQIARGALLTHLQELLS